MEYKNRITGSGEEKLDQIMFNPRNWRIHPMHQQDALKGVLEEVGWVQQVIVNKRTGNLIDGHLRCQLAAREGNDTIPVVYVDLSEEEEALILSTLDPIAGMAATDKEKLDDLFRQFNSDNEDVQKLIADIAEKEKLEFGKKPIEDAEPQIDKAEELRVKWGVETGQMWKLGEHRLICGDCTDKAVVERATNSEQYSLIADPPYNIGFNYQNIDDALSEKEYADFCNSWLTLHLTKANGIIVTPGPKNELLYPKPRDKGIWLKRYASAGASCFHLRACEPIFFYGKFASKRTFDFFDYSSGFTKELREAQRTSRVEDEHPPAKPIELWKDLISMFGDGLIVDCFGGNGTTLMACLALDKRSATIEIYPAYCSVIIQRWVDATGGVPELIEQIE